MVPEDVRVEGPRRVHVCLAEVSLFQRVVVGDGVTGGRDGGEREAEREAHAFASFRRDQNSPPSQPCERKYGSSCFASASAVRLASASTSALSFSPSPWVTIPAAAATAR